MMTYIFEINLLAVSLNISLYFVDQNNCFMSKSEEITPLCDGTVHHFGYSIENVLLYFYFEKCPLFDLAGIDI